MDTVDPCIVVRPGDWSSLILEWPGEPVGEIPTDGVIDLAENGDVIGFETRGLSGLLGFVPRNLSRGSVVVETPTVSLAYDRDSDVLAATRRPSGAMVRSRPVDVLLGTDDEERLVSVRFDAEWSLPPGQVRYPGLRAEVMSCLARLSDRGYQQRSWIDHDPEQLDGLDEVVHSLFDDLGVLPTPDARSGWEAILVPGDEVERLRELGAVLGPLITRLGDVPDQRYLDAHEWPSVMERSRLALAAMVRAWGIPWP